MVFYFLGIAMFALGMDMRRVEDDRVFSIKKDIQ